LFAVIVALFLAGGTLQAAGDPARGQDLTEDCANCHGSDGKGDGEIPQIAGLDEAYIVEQLRAFASGERVDEQELMGMYAEDLSEQNMADLAAYYSNLQ
jgi:cytochrome c553